MSMEVVYFFDKATSTFTYIVVDEATNQCAVIDSVMDYDHYSGTASTKSADKVVEYIQSHHLSNQWIIETHIHADHISAAYYLKDKIGGKTGIGNQITEILKFWVGIFETEVDTPLTGEQFDVLFADGDTFKIGDIKVSVMHTPGHTPACLTYVANNEIAFVGDTIFAPYLGTARCDFPGGSASELYDSIQKIYALPDETKIYLCHDYPPEGKKPTPITTVSEQKRQNVMINEKVTKDVFVELRETRDRNKEVPKLIIPSIQTNIRLGGFGEASKNGVQFIKVPINRLNQAKV